jgi:hypothetical protein
MTKAPEDPPKIAGQTAVEAAKAFFRQLQSGKIDRGKLGVEFNHLLSNDRVRQTAQRLKPFGQPLRVELDSIAERGGMEVANLRFVFKSERAIKVLLYRTPDAKIEEFLILRE